MSNWGERFPFKTKWSDEAYFEILLEIEKEAKGSILDVGCGHGELVYFFQKKQRTVKGIDIKYCGTWKEYKINCEKQFLKKEKENQYDTVILNNVLEHIKNKKKVRQEIEKTLKPKGTIIIIVPTIKARLSNILNLPKFIYTGITGKGFQTSRWLLHAKEVYGNNCIKELIDYADWYGIISELFEIKKVIHLANRKQRMYICRVLKND